MTDTDESTFKNFNNKINNLTSVINNLNENFSLEDKVLKTEIADINKYSDNYKKKIYQNYKNVLTYSYLYSFVDEVISKRFNTIKQSNRTLIETSIKEYLDNLLIHLNYSVDKIPKYFINLYDMYNFQYNIDLQNETVTLSHNTKYSILHNNYLSYKLLEDYYNFLENYDVTLSETGQISEQIL